MSEGTKQRKKIKYPEETKNGALERIRNGEKLSDVAKDLVIPVSTLFGWKQLDQEKACVSFSESYESDKPKPDESIDPFLAEIAEFLEENNTDCTGNEEAKQENKNDREDGKKNEYSQELKVRVLKRILDGEKVAALSRELGIPPSTIRHWVKRTDMPTEKRKNAEQKDNLSCTIQSLETKYGTCGDQTPAKKMKFSEMSTRDAVERNSSGEKQPDKEMAPGIRNLNFSIQPDQQKHEISSIKSFVRTEIEDRVKLKHDDLQVPIKIEKKECTRQRNDAVNTVIKNSMTLSAEDDNKMANKKEYWLEKKTIGFQRVRNGEKVADVSKDLGISESALRKWMKKDCNIADGKRNAEQSGSGLNKTQVLETIHGMSGDATSTKPMKGSEKIKHDTSDRCNNHKNPSKVTRVQGITGPTLSPLKKSDQQKDMSSLINPTGITETDLKMTDELKPNDITDPFISERNQFGNNGSGVAGVVDEAPTQTNEESNKKGNKKEHSLEIRTQALQRISIGGEKVSAVSRNLSIPKSTIRTWLKKEGNITDKVRDTGSLLNKTQKIKREDVGVDFFKHVKWKKWQDVMSHKNNGTGWTRRGDVGTGFRFEKLKQYFEDRYGLFEIAVSKQPNTPVKLDQVVFVKDGKILTLIERYCKYGFQNSELINDKLRDGYGIKARCYYTDSEDKAAEERVSLLEKCDYAWNKTKRDDVTDDSLSGDWNGWIVVMSPDEKDAEWIKRDGDNFGYRYEKLQSWFKDKFGVFEMVIYNFKTPHASVVLTGFGKILTYIRNFCTGNSTKSDKINEMLQDGYDVLVRCWYVTPGTEHEARKTEAELLTRYEYDCHRQRVKRETVKDDHFSTAWTKWMPIMRSKYQDGWCARSSMNVGYRFEKIETLVEDKFGVFELKTEQNDRSEVVYVQHGKIIPLLQRYCHGDCQIAEMLNKALKEEYTIWVRCHYVLSENGKAEAAQFIRQLLKRYDYSWNKTRREEIDDSDIAGDWSDWVTVLTSGIRQGWVLRDDKDVRKGYRRENFARLFEDKYGTFEMKICPEDKTNGIGTVGEVVFIGKGDILTEVNKRCYHGIKQSLHIDTALTTGKSICIRYCYTKSDKLDEAADLERQLLDRYDYHWIRTKREDVYGNDLPGEWSEWEKIMKPGEVENDWEWRDERYIGFKIKNIERHFKNIFGVFEIAIEKSEQDVVVHLGKGKILSELQKYCKINSDGSCKSLQISDSLVKRYNILVRYREAQSKRDAADIERHFLDRYREAQSKRDAADIERHFLDRYDYPWNLTKREEVDDSCIPGEMWSDWEMFMAPRERSGWIRRDEGQTGYRQSDKSIADTFSQNPCGVYEWRIEKHGRSIVVYAGKADSLLQRLTDYCKSGSHKKEDFKKALTFGYSVYVRFRYIEQPEDAENELLDRYDYAWNKLRNDMARSIFLPDHIELQNC